ncbi:hypothetical protein [Antarcticimicrobium sediminis]|uniref:Uncharacterized protein n=1 Tax=Antarcticimicrobium sediminis TaxID=2546227 RepID=A0A4R5EIH4_9RHOB|nr:hypothetical protein [Antarcticimicrobium sediminis]TDE34157.1 hypothetical protein E1B25_20420 [Antarcticimicrobium sediminis]
MTSQTIHTAQVSPYISVQGPQYVEPVCAPDQCDNYDLADCLMAGGCPRTRMGEDRTILPGHRVTIDLDVQTVTARLVGRIARL